jgi:serine/threonine-protein phosphatase 5
MLIVKCSEIFDAEKSLVNISVDDDSEITVCGDIHGQFYDLLNIFSINGNPSETNPYIFNGDFIDRGSFCAEVMNVMMSWKVLYPKHFYMSRGNHESKNLNKLYGFEHEIKHKYDAKTYELFSDMFTLLPIGHLINNKILIMHGGLFSKDGVKLDDIKNIQRKREIPEEGIMCECLWSDPQDDDGRTPSKRGVGISFGPNVAAKFLDENGLSNNIKHDNYSIYRDVGEEP